MIDSSIAMGVKPVQIDNPMNALAQMLQIQQGQQANQLNQMKMDEYTQGVSDKNAMRQLLGGFGQDHEANAMKLLQGGHLAEAKAYTKNRQDLDKSKADTAKTYGEVEFKKIETAHKRMESIGQRFGFVRDNPTAENAISVTQSLMQDGLMSQEQGAAAIAKIQADPSPQTIQALATQAYQGALSAKDQLPTLGGFNAGDRYVQTSRNPMTGVSTQTGSTAIGQSADNKASNARAAATAQMVDARARAGQAQSASQHADNKAQNSKAPPGYRFSADGQSMEAIPGGPADLKNGAESIKKSTEAKDVLSLLDEVDKLLPTATGSYLGAGVDMAAGTVGYGTKGAEGTAQLKALEGALISKMPKMSGPQSDKDVLLYKQMAGQVGDQTIPTNQRQAAANMVRKLNEKYAGMAEGSSKPESKAYTDAAKEARYLAWKAKQ